MDGALDDFDPELFVYIKIPAPLGPLERGERYEDPLEAVLSQHQLGEVSGGGSQLGDEGADGTATVAFCGVDVSSTDRERTLAMLRDELLKLPHSLELPGRLQLDANLGSVFPNVFDVECLFAGEASGRLGLDGVAPQGNVDRALVRVGQPGGDLPGDLPEDLAPAL